MRKASSSDFFGTKEFNVTMISSDQLIAAILALEPQTQSSLVTILDEAATLVPSADAAVRACASRAEASIARELQEDSMILANLVGRLQELHLPAAPEHYLAGLLDYHRELVGQAGLFAFGHSTDGNREQRAALANGFGHPAIKLIDLRDALRRLIN